MTEMFRIEFSPETKEHFLVASDGDKLPIREDVWQRLRDPEQVFGEWKKLLQKWSIHVNKAELLKRECPTDQEYRILRTDIRMFKDPA